LKELKQPMDNNTLAIYIHELRNQCLNAEASFNLFNQAMESKAGPGILFASQMILMPSSLMASMLWPTRARARSRGESLRKVLQLPEKHALNDRRLAELWERADEKSDEWIANTKGQKVLFDFVGDPATVGEGDTPIECIYRAYNPAARLFFYRGVGYNMQAIANAISDISGRVNAVYRQLFPEQAKADDEARKQQQAQAAAAQSKAAPAVANDTAPEKEAKPAPKKKAATKAAPKKPAAKAPAKKATPKKAAPKKTTAKKAPAKS
jgi:hypothetical protein